MGNLIGKQIFGNAIWTSEEATDPLESWINKSVCLSVRTGFVGFFVDLSSRSSLLSSFKVFIPVEKNGGRGVGSQ